MFNLAQWRNNRYMHYEKLCNRKFFQMTQVRLAARKCIRLSGSL